MSVMGKQFSLDFLIIDRPNEIISSGLSSFNLLLFDISVCIVIFNDCVWSYPWPNGGAPTNDNSIFVAGKLRFDKSALDLNKPKAMI